MKNILMSFWFWGILLTSFIVIILWDDKFEEGAMGAYVKHKMILRDVNFSQVEGGFEHARLYADNCEMDDNQNNINAFNVRTRFYKKDVATWSGRLIAERGLKNPFEAKFWGDVRAWNSDRERIRTDEMRYYLNRKELHSQQPVTIWKDDAIITGLGMSYNTQTKEATINQQVMIRIWDQNASSTAATATDNIAGVPVAPPLEQLLIPLRNLNASATTASPTPDNNLPGNK
ncbi:MAG TPA: LPS export ABC transporter periplasmic protein LptC [Candidatus Rifleibacterium sp.]|nr:LPS export ABC transporter periplasmic protein LptC [Candidatus Rifleibacterium sp.]HPT46622.1 LPS export ABC transporter periplasmic protein LptC [Candidatus Rifleibacterium sp.]